MFVVLRFEVDFEETHLDLPKALLGSLETDERVGRQLGIQSMKKKNNKLVSTVERKTERDSP